MENLICIVEQDKFCWFEEYLIGLNMPIRFYPCRINKGERILVVQQLLDLNYEDASFIGLLNTEQVTRPSWQQSFVDNLNKYKLTNVHLFDYSGSNIKYLEETFKIKPIHLPCKPTEQELTKLKHLISTTEKVYDYAFIGITYGRRELILNNLEKLGLKINRINNKWGIERDSEVAKCKVLLNLHFAEDYQIFEEIRCNRWMLAGMSVVSEPSLYDDQISYKNNLQIFILGCTLGPLFNPII